MNKVRIFLTLLSKSEVSVGWGAPAPFWLAKLTPINSIYKKGLSILRKGEPNLPKDFDNEPCVRGMY